MELIVFTQRNFVADYWIEIELCSQKRQIRFLSHPLGDLVRISSIARWKAMVSFLFMTILQEYRIGTVKNLTKLASFKIMGRCSKKA